MNKRLIMLEKLTASPTADAFTWYGLAMEYRNESQMQAALEAFQTLRSRFPDYLPQYLMAGQLLLDDDRPAEARVWLQQGILVAQAQNNTKALGELLSALEQTSAD